jgi:hypothetical protein
MDYDNCAALARLCANNARLAQTKEVAAELWKMARQYQVKAAKLDGGKAPDIGNPPLWIVK